MAVFYGKNRAHKVYLKTIVGAVIPAKAGIYVEIPAFAGMTGFVVILGILLDYH